jgi:hypothetical protein
MAPLLAGGWDQPLGQSAVSLGDGRHQRVGIVRDRLSDGRLDALAAAFHEFHFLGLSPDPLEKIEIVDRPDHIDRLLPALDEMMGGGLTLIEDVRVARYTPDQKRKR